ncbi:MAG TPA: TonB-dependent receptor [Steroidobacteraceae bacterium]|nr:TonB-dependent receptor [Steroidobacteraceae bacterium]
MNIRFNSFFRAGLTLVCCCTWLCMDAQAMGQSRDASALKDLSLDELMNLEVTSVSRSTEPLENASAAVTVITSDEIRRSGATTIPDALRFVPGLHVAQRNANSWAIGSRGFSSINSEKLLVLSDTRSLYTPLFSGVFWDSQDYLMHDIERIEVIRGPGAALWGSNAVNGVISITTKNARDTQDLYLESRAGTEERAMGAARYGGRLGDSGFFRVFGQYTERDATYHPDNDRSDDWRMGHAGFRADWDTSDTDSFTLQGDAYQGNAGQLRPGVSIIGREEPVGDLEVKKTGANVLGRWEHRTASGANAQTRFYYDRTHRNDPSFIDDLDTFDLDFQYGFVAGSIHQAVWGVNYRYTNNRNHGRGVFALRPESSRDSVASGFVQDQIAIAERGQLTLGTKVEYNDFSGFEWQPSIRLAWELPPASNVWASISRAVRVPTRLERDVAIDATDPNGNPVARLLGSDDFDSEELLAYEVGYRWQAASRLSIDIAAYRNEYQGLASLEFGDPFVDSQTGQTVIPIVNRNLTDGHSQGIETQATYAPTSSWRLTATYAYVDLHLDPHGQDLNRGTFLEGATPRNQFGLRSSWNLPHEIEVDAQFRYLSRIRSLPEIVDGSGIDGYSSLDLHVAWHPLPQWTVAIVGQNLLDKHHVEFGTPDGRGEIERSVYAKVAYGM